MSNGDMKAYLCANGGGLSKRELFAMAAMQALITKSPFLANPPPSRGMPAATAVGAVEYADALLSELAKEPQV